VLGAATVVLIATTVELGAAMVNRSENITQTILL